MFLGTGLYKKVFVRSSDCQLAILEILGLDWNSFTFIFVVNVREAFIYVLAEFVR